MRKSVGIVVGVCIVLGFLVSPMSMAAEGIGKETRLVSEEAFLEYVGRRKEVLVAHLIDGFIPTLGYVYVDQWWPRGAKFLGMMIAGGVLGGSEDTMTIGLVIFYISYFWEKFDLTYAVRDYNIKLAKELVEKHRVELSFNGKQEKISVGLACCF